MGTWKSPTAAPEPEEEPPGVREGSWGLVEGLLFSEMDANSVVVVLPKMSAPAARKVMTGAASVDLAGSFL